MKTRFLSRLLAALTLAAGSIASAQFVHPGCLSTQADLDRMAAKVAANAQPWKAGYDLLVQAPYGQLGHTPSPQATVYVSGSQPDNYINLARDAGAAYQVALRYHVSGDEAFAAKAVSILMAWANTHTSWNGNTNVSLRAGLYGYQLACAGELVRNYSGWAPADFATFQNYIRTHFYKIVSPNDVDRGFLFHHHSGPGDCVDRYWANWDMAAMATVIASSVLLDDPQIFQEAIDYFYNGVGVGRISKLLYHLHPNGLGQSQEFGRDQGHASMLLPLLGTFCEIAWNQGVDLYSELDNAFLAMSENQGKYNLWYDTPYVPYANCTDLIQTNIGGTARGSNRAGVEMVYNHYVNRMGLSAPYTKEAAESIRPEGGGGQYGPNSGGFDQLGFTTLTHSLDPVAAGVVPSQPRASVKGGKITLSWRGSARAESYNVKRATSPGGPYINLAKVGYKNTAYIDTAVPAGTTCYYIVSANNPDGESAPCAEISAAHDGQLYGALIGPDGSAANWGATKGLAMDGSLRNYTDFWAPEGGWVGLDLGANASAVITAVKYCPRAGQAWRMVGGRFQASNTADFSSGVVDLLTLASEPPGGVLTTQNISNGNAFRYVRFVSAANTYCGVAEVQFIGNVTGMTPPAAAPAGLAVTSPWTDQATLTWSSVPGATDYVVKRATTPGGPYIVIDYNPAWDMDYTERRLEPGTYHYVVSALNSIGETADSNEVSIVIGASNAPAMVTHLAFDETSGTVAADSSGNGRNGVLVNGPTWTAGTRNNAVNLDGADDHVDLPDGLFNGIGNCTIATWVRPDTLSTWARLFDFGTGTTSYMFLAPQAGGSGNLRFAITNNSFGSEQQINAGAPLATGVWSHVAVTLNGSTGILYVNGVEVGRNSSMSLTPASLGNTTQNYIGKAQFPDPYFDGRVDDFYVYNFALDPAEVTGLMAFTEPDLEPDPDPETEPTDTTPPAAPAGLVATGGDHLVTLDWADNTEADIARYTVYRSTTPGGPYTAIASNLTFSTWTDTTTANGTTHHYVVTASDTSLNESNESAQATGTPQAPPPPAAPASLAASTASGSRVDLTWSVASGAGSYIVKRSTTSGGPYDVLATNIVATAYSDISAALDTTYHYVVVAVNSGGESPASAEATARIETSARVKHLHLKFDEASGTTAADSSGNGRTATLVNGPSFAAGRLGNALAFTASSSHYATLPSGVVSALNDFTFSTWVKPTIHDNWARVFDFGTGTATNMFLTLQSGATAKPRFAIKINNSAEQIIDAPEAIATGVWTHVAVTLSGNTGTLYINGVAVASHATMTFKPSGMGSTTQNYLGKAQYPDPYFNGAIDDFRIYTSALTSGEIGILAAGELGTPQNVAAAPGDSQIALSWNAVVGAASYTVQRSANSGGPFTDLATGVTATSYVNSGLTDGATWHYTVAAHGLPGAGVASVPVSATTYTAEESWRFEHFGITSNTGVAADSADFDGDGWPNRQEYISGTDPNDRTSLFKINEMQTTENDMMLSFPSVLGRTYRVERSVSLLDGSWSIVQENIPGTGDTIQVTDLGGSGHEMRFYRVVVVW
jgi:fibronectin type 3 domain-containing protein